MRSSASTTSASGDLRMVSCPAGAASPSPKKTVLWRWRTLAMRSLVWVACTSQGRGVTLPKTCLELHVCAGRQMPPPRLSERTEAILKVIKGHDIAASPT